MLRFFVTLRGPYVRDPKIGKTQKGSSNEQPNRNAQHHQGSRKGIPPN